MRRFLDRLIGGDTTVSQRVYFIAFLLTLLLWPAIAFASIFIFDAPIRNQYDEIARMGIVLTIWAYPVLLFLLFRLGYKWSECTHSKVWYYGMPWTPLALVIAFGMLAGSELAQSKPDNYDAKTFVRIDRYYTLDKNHVYLNNEVIEGALPESFEVVGDNYSKDAMHVFYEREIVPGADPASFVLEKKDSKEIFAIVLAHDNKDYYHLSTPLHVADYDSFKSLGEGWFIDRKQVYYKNLFAGLQCSRRMPIADYDSFRVLNDHYACDDKCVYYTDTIVKGADPATLHIVGNDRALAQDKHCVYYEGRATQVKQFSKLESHQLKDSRGTFYTDGSNIFTFDLLKMPDGTDKHSLRRVTDYRDWYADKNRVYYQNRIIPNADPQQIEIFPVHYLSDGHTSNNNKNTEYSHDGTHVYYRDSLIEGVDIATFKCGYDYVDSIRFAFDKNRFYEGHPTPLIDKLKAKY